MSKIKEDKIKELENLGFEKLSTEYDNIFAYCYQKYRGASFIEIFIDSNRTITFDAHCDDEFTDELDIFYELFSNDMVEKDGE